jgi:putative phage-type endonuclease
MLSKEQLAERVTRIGASDMPAVMGVSRFSNIHDVWLEKSGKLAVEQLDNEAIRWGNVFEAPVLARAQEVLGPLEVGEQWPYVLEPDLMLMAATLDARLIETNEPVEAKTSGLVGPAPADWWGEDDSDEVPDAYIIQTHVQMMAVRRAVKAGALDGPMPELAHVAALIGGRGFKLYRVHYSQPLADLLHERAVEFAKMVRDGVEPSDVPASDDVVKARRRVPGKVVELESDVLVQWREAKAAEKEAIAAAKEATARLRAALDDAEAGTCGELGAVTYYEQSRAEHVVKASTFRVLRDKAKGL